MSQLLLLFFHYHQFDVIFLIIIFLFPTALSIEEEFLLGLWHFVCGLGPQCGLVDLLKLVQVDKDFRHQIFDVLYVVCSMMLYLVT